MRHYAIISSILYCLVAFNVDASQPVDFSGEWWSGRCAYVNLSQVGNRISGSYKPKVDSIDDQSLELVGYKTGVDLIAFVVSLGPNGPIVVWAGQHTAHNGEHLILMKWHMAADVPDEEASDDSILAAVSTGADTFKRVKPSSCR